LRDLGTTLSHLQVLWMARCGLADLDGIPSFSSLKELYLAYNDISDLSQVSLLDNLEILDLEGNNIDDITQVQYLGLCCQLNTLTLEGNPICSRPHPDSPESQQYSYRVAVRELVPQLQYLDDVPADRMDLLSRCTTSQDWVIVKESIKDSIWPDGLDVQEEAEATISGRPSTGLRPGTGRPSSACRVLATSRPLSASRPSSARPLSSPSSRPGSSESDTASLEQDASSLTHGVGRVICGNPVKALCARRQKLNVSYEHKSYKFKSRLHSDPLAPHKYIPEHTYSIEDLEIKNREDLFAELRTWRKEHIKRLEAIQKEREPQILKISHSPEEEGAGSLSDCSEEGEISGACGSDWSSRASPDSAFQSPECQSTYPERVVTSPEVLHQSVSPVSPVSPSPPPPRSAPPAVRRVSETGARRLRIPVSQQEQKSPQYRDSAVALCPDEEVTLLEPQRGSPEHKTEWYKAQQGRRVGPGSGADSLRPESGPAAIGVSNHRSSVKHSDRHQPIIRSSVKTPEGALPLSPARPLTARAVLQRLPNRAPLLPSRGSTTSS
ncbi:LRC56 protein, partial [Amia calva]|nr:LRC56 protein [Amia calva]